MELMEQLAKLPPLAIVVFGATLAVLFGVRYLGLLSGANAASSSTKSAAQVAAVIVDPTALNRTSDAIEDLVSILTLLVKVGEGMQASEARMAIELDRIREELRIQREIARNRE